MRGWQILAPFRGFLPVTDGAWYDPINVASRRVPSRLLFRLILSYAVVSFTTIALIGVGVFWVFLNRYNREIEALDKRLVQHVADAVNAQLLEPARTLYFRLVTDQESLDTLSYFTTHELAGSHYRIVGVHVLLNDAVSPHRAAVESVRIHYRRGNFSVSSTRGVKYDDRELLYEELETDEVGGRRRAIAGFWRVRGDTLEYVRQYPFSVEPTAAALLSVSIPIDRVYRVFRELSAEYADFLLIQPDGAAVAPGSAGSVQLPRGVLRTVENGGSLSVLADVSERTSMITVSPIARTDWRIAKITPVDAFYQRSRATRNILLIVCLSALSVCAAMSVAFARGQYDPLRRMAGILAGLASPGARAGAEVGVGAEGSTGREELDFEGMINRLGRISVEMNELRKSVAANRPILRHHLVQKTLYGSIQSEAEFRRRVQLLGIARSARSFRAVVVDLHRRDFDTFEWEDRSGIVYHLIDRIEEFRGSCIAMAGELSDNRLGVLVLGAENTGADVRVLVDSLSRYLGEDLGISHTVGVGRRVESPTACYLSYHEAIDAADYAFFRSRRIVYFDELALSAASAEVPYHYRTELVEALHSRDAATVRRAVRNLVSVLSGTDHPAAECRMFLAAIKSDVSAYAERVGHVLLPSEKRSLQHTEESFESLEEFAAWLESFIRHVFDEVEEGARNGKLLRMRRVQDYIKRRITEPISLELVADSFSITPGTLSRDFKSLCGVNFVDYVRSARLDHAQRLLSETDQSVRQVAERSGFNSSSYFIQQFKRQFGLTPAQYRESHTTAEP